VIAGPDDLVVTAWGARFMGRRLRCAVGRGGIDDKRGEGDRITPRGVWRLRQVWYRPDRVLPVRSAVPCRVIGVGDSWSDDPADPAYNRWCRARGTAGFSRELLRRADRMYDLVAVTDFNWCGAVPGAGSAIFLHVWRTPRYPTAGCVGFARPDLAWVLAHWAPRSRLVIGPV